MKWWSVAASVLVASSSVQAFTTSTSSAFTPRKITMAPVKTSRLQQFQMNYSVGIVGATGAVGKEIKDCLENRNFPVSSLRIFGSERSAGKVVATKFGEVTVELFDVDLARQCDFCFLAVSGDFSKEYAHQLTENDGCIVIDNSVRDLFVFVCEWSL